MRTLFTLAVVLGLAAAQVPVLVCDAGPGVCMASALTFADHTCHTPTGSVGHAASDEPDASEGASNGHAPDGCLHQILHTPLIGGAAPLNVDPPPLGVPALFKRDSVLEGYLLGDHDDAARAHEIGRRVPAPNDPCLRGDRLLL